jgi:low affinity Fe/Cu permease
VKFLIQNTQNRDTAAIERYLKRYELLAAAAREIKHAGW